MLDDVCQATTLVLSPAITDASDGIFVEDGWFCGFGCALETGKLRTHRTE